MAFDRDDAGPDDGWSSELGAEPSPGSSIVEGNDVEDSVDTALSSPMEATTPAETPIVAPSPPDPLRDPSDPAALAEYQRKLAEYSQMMSTLSNVQHRRDEATKDIARNLRG
jgi:hypothetical protein